MWPVSGAAGISLFDLDFDGTPELLAVDTEFVDMGGGSFFGDTDVRVFRLSGSGVTPAGGFTVPDYCYAAELTLYKGNGSSFWAFPDDGGLIRAITSSGGGFSASDGAALSYAGSETAPLMPNECWVRADGSAADADTTAQDISAIAEAYFS